jgi:hypothetical protein
MFTSVATYARRHHIALLALFVALGGTSYAALKLPAGSVGTKQLKNRAVTGAKVKPRSLKAKHFATGQLPAGPKGDRGADGAPCLPSIPGCQGPKGDTGAAGPGARWALVDPVGPTIVRQSGGITAFGPSTGNYLVDFGSPVTGHAIIGSGASTGAVVTAGACGKASFSDPEPADAAQCSVVAHNNQNTVIVNTRSASGGGAVDARFYVMVLP